MPHPIYRVTNVEPIGSYVLRVQFDDGTVQAIDFRPILAGEVYGPLRDAELFRRVTIDRDVHTLVWPNGADFDPETLHDWPLHKDALQEMARKWDTVKA